MDNAKQMLAAARLLIEIAETLMDSPRPAEPAAATAAPAQPAKSHKKGAGGGMGKGNYPRKKKFECIACHYRFESTEALLDVTCPECNSTNIIKQPQDRQV